MSNKELPQKFMEQYWDLTQEELLAKLHESEQANVEKNKKIKEQENGFSKEKTELEKRLEKIEGEQKSREKSDFLRWKEISDDELKAFEERISKGYSLDDAYLLATKDSQEARKNTEALNSSGDLIGRYSGADVKTISKNDYNALAKEWLQDAKVLEKFKEIDQKIIKGEIEVI